MFHRPRTLTSCIDYFASYVVIVIAQTTAKRSRELSWQLFLEVNIVCKSQGQCQLCTSQI